MADKWFITWDDVEKFIDEVIDHYKGSTISGIYGIPRGGIVLASILSYRMDVAMLMAPHKDCIIIDDISDTGETLMHYARNSCEGRVNKGYHIVTMFYKEDSAVKPEFYKFIKTDRWIVYPWEKQ